jgi:syntaxin 8
MATPNPSQLFLLADHIKLSLLERQRALQLNLPANSQDSQISRSLDQLSTGIDALDRHLASDGDPLSPDRDQLAQLRHQERDLVSQFRGDAEGKDTVTSPNDPALKPDFDAAMKRERASAKAVRFTDDPSEGDERSKANRAALFPYRDNPEDEDVPPDHEDLTNEQIHVYHQGVMQEQDEQLDQLGHSIGRQRELSIAIGTELDDHVLLLDEVDERVDRHQSQLDGAVRRLGKIAKKARENWSMTTIVVLIIILVLLIIITK